MPQPPATVGSKGNEQRRVQGANNLPQVLTYNFPQEERLGRVEQRVRRAGQVVTHRRVVIQLREENKRRF